MGSGDIYIQSGQRTQILFVCATQNNYIQFACLTYYTIASEADIYIQSAASMYVTIVVVQFRALQVRIDPRKSETRLRWSRVYSDWFFRGDFLARLPSPGRAGGEGNSSLPKRAKKARMTSPSERPSALARARAALTSSLRARVVSIMSFRCGRSSAIVHSLYNRRTYQSDRRKLRKPAGLTKQR